MHDEPVVRSDIRYRLVVLQILFSVYDSFINKVRGISSTGCADHSRQVVA